MLLRSMCMSNVDECQATNVAFLFRRFKLTHTQQKNFSRAKNEVRVIRVLRSIFHVHDEHYQTTTSRDTKLPMERPIHGSYDRLVKWACLGVEMHKNGSVSTRKKAPSEWPPSAYPTHSISSYHVLYHCRKHSHSLVYIQHFTPFILEFIESPQSGFNLP